MMMGSVQQDFYRVVIKNLQLFLHLFLLPACRHHSLGMEGVLMTYGLTCHPKHGGVQDKTFLVTHPMADLCERCLTSQIARRAH
jgi:hypothetical protein